METVLNCIELAVMTVVAGYTWFQFLVQRSQATRTEEQAARAEAERNAKNAALVATSFLPTYTADGDAVRVLFIDGIREIITIDYLGLPTLLDPGGMHAVLALPTRRSVAAMRAGVNWFQAANHNSIPWVQILHNSSPNPCSDVNEAMFIAMRLENWEILKFLLAYRPDDCSSLDLAAYLRDKIGQSTYVLKRIE